MFSRLFKFLFYACDHKWGIIKKTELYYGEFIDKNYIGDAYQMQCEKCGNLKRKQL